MIYEDDYHDRIVPHDLWTVKLNFPRRLGGDLPGIVASALEEVALSLFLHNREAADGDSWTITLTTLGPPDKADILRRVRDIDESLIAEKDIIAERLPEKDWLKHVHENFPPIASGRFFIYGSHYAGEKPAGLIPLQIDAATAFGSGEHETTRGCLLALEYLKEHGVSLARGLDMGCGSGILAIAMLKLWPQMQAAAVDIDPESITVTRRHAAMNNVAIAAEAGDGYQVPLVAANGPYDIIAANILANPLIMMAPDLVRHLKPGGYAVLSGLLRRQRDAVVAAHEKEGLRLMRVEEIGTPETGLWQALLLQK